MDSEHRPSPLPDEPYKWLQRFELYLNLGPARTMLAAVRAEERAQGKAKLSRSCPNNWYVAARRHNWKERAQAWDACQREQLGSLGRQTRIKKLHELLEGIEAKLQEMIAVSQL
jgi:hypothetical protein